MKFTFPKEEKLKSRKQIELLFVEGNSLKEFPLRIRFLKLSDTKTQIKAGFSVPKRNFKLAVKRIQIKRLLREVYRKNKHILFEELKGEYIVMFLYTDKIEWDYVEMEKKMISLINKLVKNEA